MQCASGPEGRIRILEWLGRLKNGTHTEDTREHSDLQGAKLVWGGAPISHGGQLRLEGALTLKGAAEPGKGLVTQHM